MTILAVVVVLLLSSCGLTWPVTTLSNNLTDLWGWIPTGVIPLLQDNLWLMNQSVSQMILAKHPDESCYFLLVFRLVPKGQKSLDLFCWNAPFFCPDLDQTGTPHVQPNLRTTWNESIYLDWINCVWLQKNLPFHHLSITVLTNNVPCSRNDPVSGVFFGGVRRREGGRMRGMPRSVDYLLLL